MAKSKTVFFLFRMRKRVPEMGREVPRLRKLEYPCRG